MDQGFAPWAPGTAHREGNTITGMLMLKQEHGLRLVETEIVHDGQGLMFVFEVMEGSDGADTAAG